MLLPLVLLLTAQCNYSELMVTTICIQLTVSSYIGGMELRDHVDQCWRRRVSLLLLNALYLLTLTILYRQCLLWPRPQLNTTPPSEIENHAAPSAT